MSSPRIDAVKFGRHLAEFIVPGDAQAPRARMRWETVGQVLAGELNALHARVDELRSETVSRRELEELSEQVKSLERTLAARTEHLA